MANLLFTPKFNLEDNKDRTKIFQFGRENSYIILNINFFYIMNLYTLSNNLNNNHTDYDHFNFLVLYRVKSLIMIDFT